MRLNGLKRLDVANDGGGKRNLFIIITITTTIIIIIIITSIVQNLDVNAVTLRRSFLYIRVP